jgi:hypothetical protein
MSSQKAAKAVQAGSRVVAVNKVRPPPTTGHWLDLGISTSPWDHHEADRTAQKYTLQSHGIYERIRRAFAVDPNRSNGVPLNPQFRNPPPGSNDPFSFTDPVTLPAGDIADNPYWKRDVRRGYAQASVVSQADVVGLLTVGSQSAPKQELIGDAGTKALVEAKQAGETGLAAYFGGAKGRALESLGKDGLPPLPSGASLKEGADKYNLTEENAYPAE